MTISPDILVFSDLDGTLIDHETYAWSAAKPALAALKKAGAGVVLSSSKTAAEMIVLRTEMGLNDWPAIVENGAGVLPSGAAALPEPVQYAQLRAVLDQLPEEFRQMFTGFGDMSIADLVEATGLDQDAAALAKERCFSEPGLWSGDEAQKGVFLKALEDQGITAQQGGRFLTLSFGSNKADQMRALAHKFNPKHTIALGDAPNDIQMLEAAEFPVVIKNPHRAPLAPLVNETRAIRTQLPGPQGWNVAILDLLNQIAPNPTT
ncbi:HAD-IIB family hydrolase [Cognatishimia activa]|uniref:Glucosyl-3-phosphoglycerate/mannosyl-3-phosphoglycerate phosphatase n=1 Tax=Cognatishimia activa TaxID=1715691 RepID=A0A0P1ISY0_9RHOB|nr:HAD-IIB family hydrolase [Cognatishimia activa]CUI74170.1 Glucosyl-3-phosphoglycerate/mannosyl-3-phosphoglycerate phosphatase [Cognatishimia activa]CUK26670.1 Glucosyl-3-phosphoglycerate/mannosyl-3-phosphoglycerate phosphatase [Cognatishimia activa]